MTLCTLTANTETSIAIIYAHVKLYYKLLAPSRCSHSANNVILRLKSPVYICVYLQSIHNKEKTYTLTKTDSMVSLFYLPTANYFPNKLVSWLS